LTTISSPLSISRRQSRKPSIAPPAWRTLEIIARAHMGAGEPRFRPMLLPNRLSGDEISHSLLSWTRLLGLEIMPMVQCRDEFVSSLTQLRWRVDRPARRDILMVAQKLLSNLIGEKTTEAST
jgi:hypothetical protein